MSKTRNQFTPQQVLEAGRRAESDGQRDYAIQFYQHLLSNNAAEPEALEAGNALRRLEAPGGNTASSHHALQKRQPQTPFSQPAGVGHRPSQPAHAQSSQASPYVGLAPAVGQHPGKPQFQSPRPMTGSNKSRARGRVEKNHDATDDRIKPKPYRLGRFMAALLGFFGLVAAVAGLVSLGANAVNLVTTTPNGILALLATSPVLAGALIALACVLILLSQMAKATFDGVAAQTPPHPKEHD